MHRSKSTFSPIFFGENISEIKTSLLCQVRRIFAEGILEHARTARRMSWSLSKPRTLMTHLGVYTLGIMGLVSP
jgi:hypothetical protein